jgi:diguanylate cyclase (GGDEF)-like protein
MDLDRFGAVNDSLGHAAGDEYLGEIAERLSDVAGEQAVACRAGGDEFVVLAPVCDSDDGSSAIRHLGDRCVQVARRPVRVREQDIVLSMSVGVVVAEPVAVGLSEALRQADAALYRAKADGRDRVVVVDEGLSGLPSSGVRES